MSYQVFSSSAWRSWLAREPNTVVRAVGAWTQGKMLLKDDQGLAPTVFQASLYSRLFLYNDNNRQSIVDPDTIHGNFPQATIPSVRKNPRGSADSGVA